MPGLNIPFDYASNLIGQEIIYRALSQQERFAQSSEHGASWSQQDSIEKSQAYFQANVLRTEFSIPSKYEHCRPEPPCPWDKEGDDLKPQDFMPIIMATDGVYSYSYKAFQRVDANKGYSLGPSILDYNLDQSKLDAKIRSEFTLFEPSGAINYQGPAVLVVEKSHRGVVESSFHYLFNLIP